MAKKTQKDFFSMYHSAEPSRFTRYLFPGAIALAFAFGIVAMVNGDIDMRGLAANVTNVSRGTEYDADLIVSRHASSLDVTLGANADGVDRVEFTLLGDPERLHSVSSSDTRVVVTAEPELGAYRVSITQDGKNVRAGTKLATLSVDSLENTQIALTDAAFVSGIDRYNLTSKVE